MLLLIWGFVMASLCFSEIELDQRFLEEHDIDKSFELEDEYHLWDVWAGIVEQIGMATLEKYESEEREDIAHFVILATPLVFVEGEDE